MELVLAGDRSAMNWLRPDFPYAEVRLPGAIASMHGEIPSPLRADVTTAQSDGIWRTTVTITNTGAKPFFSGVGEIGITLPLEDRYDLGAEQGERRCNVHVFAAGTASYVVAKRMNGRPPHLGLVLTEGALDSYSIERDLSLRSNDRGCFILHPEPLEFVPGESHVISWAIFPFADLAEFYAKAGELTKFVHVESDQYVLLTGETTTLTVRSSFEGANVVVQGHALEKDEDGAYRYRFAATDPGEHRLRVEADEVHIDVTLLVKGDPAALIEDRCRFICERQQYAGPIEALRGALLTYDNEDERPVYTPVNDLNAGRERVGMGVLLAMYRRALRDGTLTARHAETERLVEEALSKYRAFVLEQLVEAESGTVANDVGRDNSYERLYNAPWFARFFLEMFQLSGEREDALLASRILFRFYEDGGHGHYPIELPILSALDALERIGADGERAALLGEFRSHADQIARMGTAYPPSEVNYEQSIVAPAAEILLQVHLATGDRAHLEAAAAHVLAMDQFQGMQPDYHLNEVAIRHWDGYWFGKRQQYGDTFPHYWSGITGNVYALLHRITGERGFAERAKRSLRGTLPLILEGGRASCALVYPHSINGERGVGLDPYANDQDWALVFALRQTREDPASAPF